MLTNIFHTILKMNFAVSIMAVLLLSVKFIFQKIGFPRKVMFLLWTVIAFRLICPVSISTDISVLNIASDFADSKNAAITQTAQIIQAGRYANETAAYQAVPNNNVCVQSTSDSQKKIYEYTTLIPSFVWLAGMCIMFLLGITSYVLLKKRLRFAVKLKENIYTAEKIPTSFVFGIFRPKIYIPENTCAESLHHIIVHEKTHIKRADNLTKMIAYMILSVHWFNPLNWVMFKLFSDDMEFACDETVMSKLGFKNKKQYVNTLLQSAENNPKTILLYNVCFSANPTKRRIKNMIKLKEHSKILTIAAIAVCAFIGIAFGTNATEYKSKTEAAMQKQADASLQNNNETPLVAVAPDTDIENKESAADAPITTASARPKHTVETTQQADVKSPNTQQPVPATANTHAPKKTESTEPPAGKNNIDDIDFEQKIFDSGTQLSTIEQELNNRGITQSNHKSVKLGQNYVINDYSFENDCRDVCSNVTCDKGGNISLYFDVNAENLVDVTFADSETKEVVAEFGILANDKNSYSFTGFSDDKTYDVEVHGKTQGNWKIEGQYIIY